MNGILSLLKKPVTPVLVISNDVVQVIRGIYVFTSVFVSRVF